MNLDENYTAFVWHRYTKKMEKHILVPSFAGRLADAKGRVVEGLEESHDGKFAAKVLLDVDESNGEIKTIRFQTRGSSGLIAILDMMCELTQGLNVHQAKRMSAEFIEKNLRDKPKERGYPTELDPFANFALSALDDALEKCGDISVDEAYDTTPIDMEMLAESSEYPDWDALSEKERIGFINKVMVDDIVPYIELDGGGVEIKELKEGPKVVVTFSGNCGSCPASQTSTLSAIQGILRAKVHKEMIVIPHFNQ